MNTSANNAASLAANFQVAELEPRLENVWMEPGLGVPGLPGGGDGPTPEPGTPETVTPAA